MSKQAPGQEGASSHFAHPAHEASFSLVNPSTGLANDYLNVFNEILLMLEFLPTMPEMTDDALAWRPCDYREYFRQSTLPGAQEALRAYDRIEPRRRARFESSLSRLTEIVIQAQQKVAEESQRPNYPESIAPSCESTAAQMRAGLAVVAREINEVAPVKFGARNSRLSQESGI